MQAVILAAGRGSRMGSLTDLVPKPMLEVRGKTLLEHKFDALPSDVTEIIIVVGYLRDVITRRYGDVYGDTKITYVTQENIVGGTADALWQARDILTDTFFVLNGDDIYTRADLAACRVFDWALLVQEVSGAVSGGKVIVGENQAILDIVENGESQDGVGILNTGMCVLDTRIFDFPQVEKGVGSSELGLPQTILAAARSAHIPLIAVPATEWIQISTPEDIQRAERILMAREKSGIE